MKAIYPGQYEDEEGETRADRRFVHFLSKIPGSRWLSAFDKALREDRGNAEKIGSLLLGLTLSDVDEQRLAEGLRKRLLPVLKKQAKEGRPVFQMLRHPLTVDWEAN